MRWNDSYPFVEPCPGCFENALQTIREHPGNPVFMSNGDFTLSRLLEAVSKLVHKGDITLVLPDVAKDTLDTLERLSREEFVGNVTLVCYPLIKRDVDLINEYPFVSLYQSNVSMCLLDIDNGSGFLMITGLFRQERASRDLEIFTIVNDPEQRESIYKALNSKLNVKRYTDERQ